MSFIENKGQWLPNIEYKSELVFGNIYFEKDNFTFILLDNEDHNHNSEHFHEDEEHHESPKGHHFKIKFLNANENVSFETENQSLHYYNYFLGKDESKWASNVFAYKAVKYQNLYNGIDMKVFGAEDNMKYEYYVQPFQDPNQIEVQYIGIDEISLKNGNLVYETSVAGVTELKPVVYQFDGDIKIDVECKYKLNKKTKTVQFEFPNGYDETKELIIDPTLIFASYSGSTLNNFGYTATYDDDGNLFGGGIIFYFTNFTNVIDTTGIVNGYPSINSFNLVDSTYGGSSNGNNGFASDIAISKFSSDGTTLLYSTLIGGIDNEQPHSLVTDTSGDLFIFGRTYSNDFPVTSNAYDTSYNDANDTILDNNKSDIVVLKISSDGTTLLGSTYVGGIEDDGVNMNAVTSNPIFYNELRYNYADDGRGEIIVDDNGEVYITSTTKSNDIFKTNNGFQNSIMSDGSDTTTSGFQDACVFKLNSDLSSMVWGSYLGGSGNDAGYSIKFDKLGNLFVAGGTNSFDFPGTNGGLNNSYLGGRADGFLAKIDTNGSTLFQSTYLGTTDYDQSYFVEIDEFNDVYTYGQSTGGYPVFGNVYSNTGSSQFIHKLNNALDTTIFSTVFGKLNSDSVNISPTAFLVDNCLNIYISGWGGATNQGRNPQTGLTFDMPLTSDALQSSTDGSDFYFMVLSKDAENLLYATYYGGNQTEEHVDGGTSRFDKRGTIYQAVCASCTGPNNNFPTTPGSWSQTDNSQIPLTNGAVVSGGCNLGVIKMDVYIPPTIVDVEASPTASGCVPLLVNFQSNLLNVNKITWDFDDGSFSNLEDPNHLFTDTGTFNVMLIGEDTTLCNLADTAFLQVIVGDDSLIAKFIDNTFIDCNNNSVSISAENYPTTQYLWTMGDGNSYTTDSIFHVYSVPGIYDVKLLITDTTSCELIDSSETTIEILPTIDASIAVSDSFGCIDLNVIFTNQTNIPVDSLFWNFGDGNTSSLVNPNNVYTNIGNYNVSLIASDTNTCNLIDTAFAIVNSVDDRVVAAIQIDTVFFDCDSLIMRFSSLNANATSHNWDFDNGITSNDSTVDVTFSDGTYNGNYIVEDTNLICKPLDTSLFSLEVLPEIKANIALSDTFGCVDLNINFTNQTNIPVDSLFWNFGDGNTSSLVNPNNFFDNIGNYNVSLIASDTNTCNLVDTAFAFVNTVDDRVFAAIQIDTVFFDCDSLIMRFSSLNSNATSHFWDFDNGITSTDSTVDVTFSDGIYNGNYIIEDTNLICKPLDTALFSLEVLPEIKARIALSDTFGCIDLNVNFTNQTNISVDSLHWNFGDGNTSILVNPNNVYTNIGNYNVNLIASDTNTCNLSDTAFAFVNTIDDRVVAAIQIDTVFFDCDSLIMRFSSLNANATSHNWDFDNGITSNDSTVDVTFSDGIYNGNYIVEDTNLICKPLDTSLFSLEVLPEIKARIALSDTFGCVDLNINFTNQTNILVDSLFWNFGDGSTSSLVNPNSVYTNIGNYNVSLIASDTNTCNLVDTAFAFVNTIDDRVNASIQIDTVFFDCDSLIMRFSSLNANATNHFWDFDNGITSNDSTVDVTFSNGIYNGNYIVEDTSLICKSLDTALFSLEILPEIKANISLSDTFGCIDLNVNFTNQTNIAVDSLFWNFGDGNTSSLTNPNNIYTNIGNYNVSLIAFDTNTCNLSDTAFAFVNTVDDRVNASIQIDTVFFDCDSLIMRFSSLNANATSHNWDFDNGITSNDSTVDVTFSDGIYNGNYIVEDTNLICKPLDTALFSLEVLPEIKARIALSDTFGCIDLNINFTNQTNIPVDSLYWNFGDGNTSSLVNPNNVYTNIGNYNVSLIASDTNTCNLIDTVFAIVNSTDDRVNAAIQIDTLFFDCDSLLMRFSSLNANATNHFWNFDNGITSNDSSVIVPFQASFTLSSSIFDVSYFVTDTNLVCKPMDTANFKINLKPEFSFSATISDSSGCAPLQVHFSAFIDYPMDSFIWDFGDGNTSEFLGVGHTYTMEGNYDVSFLIYDTNTCNVSDSIDFLIQVANDIAIADANVSENLFDCDSLQVAVLSNNTNSSYFWDFGDGFTSTDQSLTHAYNSFGDFIITYVVYDSTKFCEPYDTLFYPIHFEPVIANITLSDDFGCIPLSVNYSTPTIAQNYFWQFGDGNISTTTSGSNTYTTVNNFMISLLVEDTLSCNVFDTAFANIQTEDTRVTADFSFTILNSCDSLLSIQLNNQSINGANYEWYFDGSNIQTVEDPGFFDFNTVGNHTILLIAINDTLCNNRDTINRIFELLPNVSADFSANNNCENQEIILQNNSVLGTEFLWNFGNGNTSNQALPNFNYNESGSYNISLTVIDSSTCNISNTYFQTIEILDFANANFEVDSAGFVYPDDVSFTNLSISFTDFLWEFGDGETENLEENPIHSYEIIYDIEPCLSVWNEFCGDTICKKIYIDFVELVGVPNAFSPNNDGINDVLYVEGIGIETMLFKIYNRWGEIVFESKSQEFGWDGKYNNVDQELEVYTYVLEAVFINGKSTTLKGNITLLR